MNEFILALFDDFHTEKIKYCHFKSNNNLEPALNGVDDLDLLVSQADKDRFMSIIAKRGFRLAHDRGEKPTPFVFHFFGADPETGLLVHLHVYFRLITGGSILKNHWIRVEDMLLSSAEPRGPAGVFIPSAEADLILFVLRKLIEQPSIIEHYLFLKDWKNIETELLWLSRQTSTKKLHELLKIWLPQIETEFFDECLGALTKNSTIAKRVKLGRMMHKRLPFHVCNEFKASILRSISFFSAHARGRLGLLRNNRVVFPGGLLISFVGSEASGKSTCSKQVVKWLSKRFDVTHIHMGKPKKSWRTIPFWLAIGIYSKTKRATATFVKSASTDLNTETLTALNQPHPLVSVLDSYDRKNWIMKHLSHVMSGGVVITDRYPTQAEVGLDGPRILATNKFTTFLSKLEQTNYAVLPPPDLVFKMIAPLDVTLARNSERDNPEPEPFVRARYALAQNLHFPLSKVVEIKTTEPLDSTILLIKRYLWNLPR